MAAAVVRRGPRGLTIGALATATEHMAWGTDYLTMAQRWPDRVAVVDDAGSTSFAALVGGAFTLAARLRDAGAAAGLPVATVMRNGVAAVQASMAVALVGAAEVPVNAGVSQRERDHCFGLVGARLAIADEALPTAHPVHWLVPGELEPMPAAACAALAAAIPPPAPGAAGRITFTSGTTGAPKAVVASQQARWVAHAMLRAEADPRPQADDRILLVTPFSHGASLLAHAFLACGASVRLAGGVHDAAIETLADGSVTQLFAPPTVLARIVDHFGGRRPAPLRLLWTGTADLQPALYRRTRDLFGPVVRVTYGMTEMVNPICVLGPAACDEVYAQDRPAGNCLGWPVSGVEVRLLDEQGGELAEPGAIGEIAVRGPQLFDGYITAEGFQSREGGSFHRTGDLGSRDGRGRLFLHGRRNDVIKTGGYKLFPQEVEAAIGAGVGEVAVFSLPSDYWGEIVVGALAGNPDARRLEAVADSLGALTSWKRPRLWVGTAELPRNATGKVDRRALREQVLARYALHDGRHPRLLPIDSPVRENAP